MSEQAKETDENEDYTIVEAPEDDETEVTEETTAEALDDSEADEESETLETEAESDEDGEVEIVLEGEEEPTSKPVRGVKRLLNRLESAKSESSDLRRELDAKDEEIKLYKAKLEQQISDKEPDPEDFDTDEGYRTELKAYYQREARKAAQDETGRLIAESQQQATQAQKSLARNSELDEHYKRVDASGIKNYDELEGAAIDVMGQEFVEEIAANNEKSHLVIAHLGVNLGKAEKFARMAKSNPVKALMEIGALANELKVKRKSSRPASPETKIDKGLARKANTDDRGVRYF